VLRMGHWHREVVTKGHRYSPPSQPGSLGERRELARRVQRSPGRNQIWRILSVIEHSWGKDNLIFSWIIILHKVNGDIIENSHRWREGVKRHCMHGWAKAAISSALAVSISSEGFRNIEPFTGFPVTPKQMTLNDLE